MARGRYVVLEGADGCGKTALSWHLRTVVPSMTRRFFPSDGIVGNVIRDALRGKHEIASKALMYLFAADGLAEDENIRADLEGGLHVICDRHPTLSGEVYQVDHHERAQITQVYGAAAADGMLVPDKLFVIDVPAEVAAARARSRTKYEDVVYEPTKLMKRGVLRERYLDLALKHGGTVIDGTRPLEDLAADIIRIAELR